MVEQLLQLGLLAAFDALLVRLNGVFVSGHLVVALAHV